MAVNTPLFCCREPHADGIVPWPQYEDTRYNCLFLQGAPTINQFPRPAAMQFWNNTIAQLSSLNGKY